MARASLFTDHKIWGLPIRATYKNFKTIWAHTFDNSPTDPTSFHKYLPHGVQILFLSSQFEIVHIYRQEQSFLSVNEKAFPIWNFLPFSKRTFSNCSPAKGWPRRFLSRGTTGSSILDHDLGHLCRGRRIQMSRHSAEADTASAACPEHPGSLERKSMTFAAWWSLFSEHCVRSWIIFHNVTSEHD